MCSANTEKEVYHITRNLYGQKFGGLASKTLYSNIGGLKFGGWLTTLHKCVCLANIFVELDLATSVKDRLTIKFNFPSNFLAIHQYLMWLWLPSYHCIRISVYDKYIWYYPLSSCALRVAGGESLINRVLLSVQWNGRCIVSIVYEDTIRFMWYN